MSSPARICRILGLSLVIAFAPVELASAQFCAPTSGGGWHNDPSGSSPGCVPLLPIPGGSPTGTLPANDDGSAPALDLSPYFPGGLRFFGGPYTSVVVNNNGNITFGGTLFTYTPSAFPLSGGVPYPMIAPYWGDVDTRGGGSPPAENYVWWYLEPGRLIVTWYNVGYYNSLHNRKMSFQMIITNASGCGTGDFDVEFRYNKCEWTTGGASGGSGGFGGTPAQVGFDAHNGVDYVSVPGSLTMAVLNQCTTSNVGEPGVWRFSVHGGVVSCPGTGTPCDTGMPGACGIGVTQCIGGGVSCVQVGSSSGERCDGIDNDCNGAVDDGSGLCSAPNVCYQGSCVPPCFEGGCGDGETCSAEGTCIDTACIGVSCAAGQRCRRGTCVDACDGVVCPHGEQCVAGQCTSLCDVITCGEGEICQDGMCRPECPCYPCPDGSTCNADGTCSIPGCDLVRCDPGFYCEAGACHDACAGAVCPSGQHCAMGHCIDGTLAAPDGGVGPGRDAGPITRYDGGGNTGLDASTSNGDAGRTHGPPPRPGCGCRVTGGEGTPSWLFGLGALALLVWRRRR